MRREWTVCALWFGVAMGIAVSLGCTQKDDPGTTRRTGISGGTDTVGGDRDAAASMTEGEGGASGGGTVQPGGPSVDGASTNVAVPDSGPVIRDAGDAAPGTPPQPGSQPEAGPQPLPDSGSNAQGFGAPCSAACLFAECYDPGTHENPICSKHCTSDADCGDDGVCQQSGNTGKWCFHRCTSNAECQLINDDSSNPLFCAGQHDPDNDEGYGSVNGAAQAFCIQSSEP
ncbi:MAG TPA: hypothetical protein VHO25_23695 [Polyangiaceae bacterium]|nr:hypothetical protein [Polyangiaceae bacterium]